MLVTVMGWRFLLSSTQHFLMQNDDESVRRRVYIGTVIGTHQKK
jgi:hypothetical protein